MPEQTTQPNKKSLPLKSLLILAVIMLLEGGLFALWMNLAGPENAAAKGIGEQLPQSAADSTAELQILQFSAPWQKDGSTTRYDMGIHVVCDKKNEDAVKMLIGKHKAQIQDRLREIVAKAEPEYFKQTSLTTFKSQIGMMLEEIMGEGMIKEVLIPECMPYRSEY